MYYYWQLPDGRIWGFREATWVTESAMDAEGALSDVPDVDEIRSRIRFYGGNPGELAAAEDLLAAFTDAVQAHLDAFARTRNYDNILSAATYATSTVAKFQAEGQYAVEARDAAWAKGYEILDAVMAGQRPLPTLDEVLAELPVLAWPE